MADWTDNAKVVLESRYLTKDRKGNLVETPDQMLERVASVVSKAEPKSKGMWQDRFLEMMDSLEFLPNSPSLMNAGRPLGNLSACFLLEIEDDLSAIFEAVKQVALIHKCVTADTYVQTPLGIEKIEEVLSRRSTSDVSLEFYNESGRNVVSEIYSNGNVPTREIRTHRGFELRGSLNHPILIMRNGILRFEELKNLQVEDYTVFFRGCDEWNGRVPINFEFSPQKKYEARHISNLKRPTIPSCTSPNLGRFVGYIIGDGHVSRAHTVLFVAAEEEMLSDMRRITRELFGLEWKRNGRKSITYVIWSEIVHQFLVSIGLTPAAAYEKEVPRIIRVSGKEVVAEFLRGYFSTDGHAGETAISVCSTSKELLKQVQLLLLKFGIVSSLRRNDRNKRTAWDLFITDRESARRFVEEIGFTLERKSVRAQEFASKERVRSDRRCGVPIISLYQKKWRKGKNRFEVCHSSSTGMVPYKKVESMFSKLPSTDEDYEFFSWLLRYKPLFDKIESVQDLPLEKTYDCVIPESHRYWTSGLLSHNSGGGTGIVLSKLRPADSRVKTTSGVSSGPVSFMKLFDTATEVVKQGGVRRGANLGALNVSHPDIEAFVNCKRRKDAFTNFNISVSITDKFMRAVEHNQQLQLVFRKRFYGSIGARSLFKQICHAAWETGDPGLLFIDEANRHNPTPWLGRFFGTNPCGEQLLLNWESCNLGSIDVSKFVSSSDLDWEKLKRVVETSVRFLDDVISVNKYPNVKIQRKTLVTRKIGLGIMGFADCLLKLNVRYDSNEGLEWAEKIAKFINEVAHAYSKKLGRERGFCDRRLKRRNATLTTIAPTGTLSLLANCSSGIEPIFAKSYSKIILNNQSLDMPSPYADSPAFVTAMEISPEFHVRMQAAFQKYTDNAVSKTVNVSESTTPQQIGDIFTLAWKLGCKGTTVFRQGCKRSPLVLSPDGLLSECDSERCLL